MNKFQVLQDLSAGFFISAIAVLSFISVLGVWEVFGSDVITKSFSTLGLLAVVSIAIIIAGRYFDKSDPAVQPAGAPVFKSVRQVTLIVLIVAAALLALVGVLAIWEIIANSEVVFRSLGSLAIIGFAAFITVMVCLERENNQAHRGGIGGPALIMLLIALWAALSLAF